MAFYWAILNYLSAPDKKKEKSATNTMGYGHTLNIITTATSSTAITNKRCANAS